MSSASTSVSFDVAPRHRNGRQQACEPCHKRKVACDHKMPVCSRCRRGSISSSCIYAIRVTAAVAAKGQPSAAVTSPSMDKPRCSASPEPLTPPANDGGYLGITSYRYAMREAQSSMPPAPQSEKSSTKSNVSYLGSGSGPSRLRMMCDDRTYEAAMRVLLAIPRRARSEELFNAYINPNDGFCRLATRWLHDSLWATYGFYLDGTRSPKLLLPLAKTLCRNNSKPLNEGYSDPKEWFESFSGPNMRWEGLGLLFTHWSFGAIALGWGIEGSKHTSRYYDKCIHRYKNCAWDCVEITRNTASANAVLLNLLYRQWCLESTISGNDSLQHSRLHGEIIALMIHLGLHAAGGSLHDRGICTQIKRRLFSNIFHSDKVVSTFAGRPPMLSRRFISTLSPLDISDEVLLGVTPWRDDLIDVHGWNTLGEIYASTLLRARAYMGFVRDSVLDIALQVTGNVNIEELINLRSNEENIIANFPQCIIFKPEDIRNENILGPKLYAKLLIQLEHLQNIFLIERLLNKAADVILSTALLQVSMELVSLTLVLWTHRDRVTGLYDNFEWLVIGYASPAAGILCLELLQASTNTTGGGSDSNISRSEVIQKLSLLNGFLDWIRLMMPKRKLAYRVRKVIERVLDQALNHPARSVEPIVDFMDWGATGINTNEFSFELLDTFDWMRLEHEI